MGRCPICRNASLDPYLRTRNVATQRCAECGHLVAEVLVRPPWSPETDLHLQYGQDAFLDSLRTTRVRQANLILEHAQRLFPVADGYLDYGAGRGWLLEQCRHRQMKRVAGLDTSPQAVQWLRARGIEAHLLEEGAPLPALTFSPGVLLLLDVVEHFDVAGLHETMRSILEAYSPELQGVIVKVPVSHGILFRTARLLRRVRPSMVEQLFLVQTSSPHRSYFSETSLMHLLRAVGLTPLFVVKDPEFEVETLTARAQLGNSFVVQTLGRVAARAALASANGLGLQDSLIVFARPDARSPRI